MQRHVRTQRLRTLALWRIGTDAFSQSHAAHMDEFPEVQRNPSPSRSVKVRTAGIRWADRLNDRKWPFLRKQGKTTKTVRVADCIKVMTNTDLEYYAYHIAMGGQLFEVGYVR